MGAGRPPDSSGPPWRASAGGGCASGAQWDSVCPGDGMSVASPAEVLAAAQHLPCLFPALDVGWHVGAPPSRPVRANTRASGSGGQSDCGDRRQSERPGGAKRGALRDPVGYDGAKKVKGVKYHIAVDTLGLLVNVAVHAADRQDRDGLPCVLTARFESAVHLFRLRANGGESGYLEREIRALRRL